MTWNARRFASAAVPALLVLGVMTFAPAHADAVSLKPVAAGTMDRNGPAGSASAATVNAFVISVSWADIQPTQDPGTDHGGALNTAAIDSALATAASTSQTVRLRLLGGINAPDWLKTMDGPAMKWYDSSGGGLLGTLGRFWADDYGDAYDDLMTKLAALYDADPRLQEVAITRCTTQFAEPFLRQYGNVNNLNALKANGYTVAADKACQSQEIATHARVWQHTRSSLAFSPFQQVNDTTFAKAGNSVNESYTESVLTECRAALGLRCVLGNNSLDSTDGMSANDPYTSLYQAMKAAGGPIYFQTTTNAKIGDWRKALQRAVDFGADSVELPQTYASWPLDDSSAGFGLTHYDALLEANAAAIDGVVPVDHVAPSSPANVHTTALSSTSVDLAWDAATDNVGVTGYAVYRDGTAVGTTDGPSFTDDGLVAGATYSYTVTALDAAGNESAPSTALVVTAPDPAAPSAPTNLRTTAVSASAVTLAWDAATDDVGVTGYTLYRDGALVGTTDQTTLTDPGVLNGRSYSYSVTASDGDGNESAPSTVLVVATPDTAAPTTPGSLHSTAVTPTSVTLTWSAATDNVGVTGYRVYRDGVAVGTPSGTSFTSTGLASGTSYTFTVTALDAASNESAPSAGAVVRTGDTTAPTAPTNLHTTALAATSVSLSWTAATDNVGVTAYNVFRGSTKVGTTATTTFTDGGVKASTTYTYTVTAVDAAGNTSAASSGLRVTTPPPPDTKPPSAPKALKATVSAGKVVLQWTAATDNVGVVGYQVFRGTTLMGSPTALTFTDTTVRKGTSYTFSVVAVDAAGNVSVASNKVTVTAK